MRATIILVLAAALVAVPASVVADEPETPTVRYKKKTEIDFEDVAVDGALKRPHGSFVLEKRQSRFNPLIKLKDNFNKEMLESVEEIR